MRPIPDAAFGVCAVSAALAKSSFKPDVYVVTRCVCRAVGHELCALQHGPARAVCGGSETHTLPHEINPKHTCEQRAIRHKSVCTLQQSRM